MSANRGKEFEELFKKLVGIEGIEAIRFHDTLYLGKKGVKNLCDFIISKDKVLPSILIECKACEKSSFSLSNFTQLEDLKDLNNFNSFLVVWYIKYKKVLAFKVEQINTLVQKGVKSINPTKLDKIKDINPIDVSKEWGRIKPISLEVSKLWKTE